MLRFLYSKSFRNATTFFQFSTTASTTQSVYLSARSPGLEGGSFIATANFCNSYWPRRRS
jgi:hypothetical protein